jgi:MFS family permease
MTVAPPTWSALVHGPRLAHSAIVTLGVGMYVVDSFMLAAVLPSIVEAIGGATFYTWCAMLYTISATLGTACGGLLAVRSGMRRSALLGVLLLLVGNVGAAVAPTMMVLLVARAVQGLGGGLLVTQAYGMASAFYPDSLRARVLTMISVAHGLAALVGPIAGGGFATIGWWRGAFWAAVPVLVVLAGLVWRFLPPRETEGDVVPLPLLRLIFVGVAVLCVAASGQVASLALRFLAVGCAAILVKVTLLLDARATARLFPSRPLSLADAVGTALWIILLFNITTAHNGVFMPLVVQVLHGVSPLWAGYFQAVLALSWTTFAVVSAGFQRRQARRAILVGPFLIACGVAGQALMVVDGPLALLAASVAMTGAGMGLCFAHISSWTMSSARPGEAVVTASSIPTMQSFGRAFGAATAGLVANAARLASGISPATVASAATWVYGLCVVPPLAIVALSLRLLWLHRKST